MGCALGRRNLGAESGRRVYFWPRTAGNGSRKRCGGHRQEGTHIVNTPRMIILGVLLGTLLATPVFAQCTPPNVVYTTASPFHVTPPYTYLDYDFRLGIFDEVLGNVLKEQTPPYTNLWTSGSPPIWTTIPGQDSALFVGTDNDDNGIKEHDHLDLLAAIIEGDASVVGGLNPADVTAIRNAFAANIDAVQLREVTITANATLIGDVTVTTGQNNSIPIVGTTYVPSLWRKKQVTNGEDPFDGLLYQADGTGLFEDEIIFILAGLMTLGDAQTEAYVQNFLAKVLTVFVAVIVPALLSNLKDADPAVFKALEEAYLKGEYTPAVIEDDPYGDPKAVISLNCTNCSTCSGGFCTSPPCPYPRITHTITTPISATITVTPQRVCNAIQDFIGQFQNTNFTYQTARLAATGNLNGVGNNNLQSYNAVSQNRQAWMLAESLANPPLQVTTQPANFTGVAGDSFTLTTATTGGQTGGTLTYQWAKTDAVYANTATMNLLQTYTNPYALVPDSGNYVGAICDGLWQRRTHPAVITISPLLFQITQQPVGGNVTAGTNHTLSFRVKGGTVVPTYQWFKGPAAGGPFTPIPGPQGTQRDLVFSPIALSDSGFYRCDATGDNGSGAVVLSSTVVQLVVLPPIVINTQPVGANLISAENHTVAVNASGGLGSLTYQWQFDATQTGSSFSNISGATSDSYFINPALPANQGLYRCRIRDGAVPPQEVFTNNALVTVLGIASQPPLNIAIVVGGTEILTVIPAGGLVPTPGNPAGGYTYAWTKVPGPSPGSTTNTLTIGPATLADSGQYRCAVTDQAGRTIQTGIINVFVSNSPIVISESPVDTGRLTGQNATLRCRASGGLGTLQFEWFFNNGGGDVSLGTGTLVSGGTDLVLSSLTAANQGAYFCRVTDTGSPQVADSATAQLYVGSPLVLNSSPTGGDFHTGDSHVLTVNVSGGVGPLTYTWTVDGNATGPNAAIYDLTPITPLATGTWVCTVNDIGTGDATIGFTQQVVNSSSVVVRVGPPLQILASGQPASQTVPTGSNVSFTVSPIGGLGVLSYQWYDAGNNAISGATGPTLSFTNVSAANNGQFYCIVTDELGGPQGTATSASASLNVADPLQITSQPVNATKQAGQTAFFAVAATGGLTGSYRYQWRKDGNDIIGAVNNVLLLSSVTPSDEGSYTVVVTDANESVESSPATLTVTGEVAGLPVAGGLGMALLAAACAAGGAAALRRRNR